MIIEHIVCDRTTDIRNCLGYTKSTLNLNTSLLLFSRPSGYGLTLLQTLVLDLKWCVIVCISE